MLSIGKDDHCFMQKIPTEDHAMLGTDLDTADSDMDKTHKDLVSYCVKRYTLQFMSITDYCTFRRHPGF